MNSQRRQELQAANDADGQPTDDSDDYNAQASMPPIEPQAVERIPSDDSEEERNVLRNYISESDESEDEFEFIFPIGYLSAAELLRQWNALQRTAERRGPLMMTADHHVVSVVGGTMMSEARRQVSERLESLRIKFLTGKHLSEDAEELLLAPAL